MILVCRRQATVRIAILYFQASGSPSKVRASDTFKLRQSDAPSSCVTLPVQYAPEW
jgi:hypothetical protein